MLTCNKCGADKDETEFHWHTKSEGIRNKICKVCRRQQYKNWWGEGGSDKWRATQKISRLRRKKELRAFIQEYKSNNPCADCGGRFHFSAMDFDHVRGEKKADISSLVGRGAKGALLVELEKCELVCSNCHRVRTYRRGEYNRME